MSLDRIANITINLRKPSLPLASFNIPLTGAALTSQQEGNWGDNLVREFSPYTYLDDLETIGVTDSEDLYVALVDLFSQERQPSVALVGMLSDAVAQVNTITLGGATDGPYVLTINGTDFSYTASSNTATQIRDALLALVNAGTQPVTASTSGANAMPLTADEPGVSFTVSVSSPGSTMTSVLTTPNVGYPTDLVQWRAERNDFYYVLEQSRSPALIKNIAGVVEAMGKLFFAQSNDSAAQTQGATTDLGSELAALGYNRTAVIYDPNNDQFVDHALVGRMAPVAPGSETYANKDLVSVSGFVPTSDTTLASKRYTWLESLPAAQMSMTQGGTVASGQWIDLIVARDWLKNFMQIRLVQALRNAGKIEFTQTGAQILGGIIRGCLMEAGSSPYNILDTKTIGIDLPTVSQLGDRGTRHLPDVRWRATLKGAIHTLDTTGDLAP
jgi:Protein of unknown function (DUF3383)